jgi:activating signal cointegrator 1
MKALCLHQPWASLMAVGAKTIETRSRRTHYRGELAICATKHWDVECEEMLALGLVQKSLLPLFPGGDTQVFSFGLPYGAVLALVDLSACHPVEEFDGHQNAVTFFKEFLLGDYSDGRFAWLTSNLRRLKEPVPVRGRQGLFNLPPDVEAQVRAQLL